MSTDIKSFDIVSGPSRDELFEMMKHAYDDAPLPTDKFEVGLYYLEGKTISIYFIETTDMQISSLEHADGSGHAFNFTGFIKADIRIEYKRRAIEYRSYEFKAYYNSKTKRGYIKLT